MNNLNNPNESGDAERGAADQPPARRRSRRASSPVMTPDAAPAPGPGSPSPEPEKAGPPSTSEKADTAQPEPKKAQPEPTGEAAASSPPRGTGRSRRVSASGKAGEKRSDSGPAKGSQDKGSQDKGSGDQESGAKSSGELDVFAEFGGAQAEKAAKTDSAREEDKTAARGGAANEDLSLDDLVLPEREGGGVTTSQSKSKQAPEAPAESPEQADHGDSPRLPATALLFQAPEVTSRRRKGPARGGDDKDETGGGSGQKTGAKKEDSKDSAPSGKSQEKPAKADSSKGSGSAKSSEQAKEKGAAEADKPSSKAPGSEESAQNDSRDERDEGDQPRRRRRRGGRGRRRSGSGSGDQSSGDQSSGGQDSGGQSSGGQSSGDQSSGDQGSGGQGSGGAGSKASQAKSGGAGRGDDDSAGDEGSSSRRRRRRTREDSSQAARDQVTPLKGSTRLEAKRQRRRDGRDNRRRRTIITEAEYLARRESVDRKMYVRESDGRTQIVVLEDDMLVEHYVAQKSQISMVGNVYLGRVQNVLPSMEAAFVDIGRGRNAVLYAGEVNWDAAGLDGQPRRIEQALKSGDFALVQVTKDPIGTKGARLTAQVTLAGRFLVLVPNGSMTGISRKLPENERNRLKKLLKELVPEGQGVIVRTAAEGATEEQLRRDIDRLAAQWADIEKKQAKGTTSPVLLKGEPELATRVVRDIFNEDFSELVISGDTAWKTLSEYVEGVAPDLADRMQKWTKPEDVFAAHRIDEQLTKGTDRKVYLPSGGSLVIDRTEAMTVIDVNTGKFTGSGGTLEETVTKNNLEAAEEIVRQLRLRDIGGIIVIDFIDMVLESNRELLLRRLVECLGRDRTRHQVAEVTSLGLVQMTRKRVSQGLVEAFSTSCECCDGRGFIVHSDPVPDSQNGESKGQRSQPKKNAAKADSSKSGTSKKANSAKDASKKAASAKGEAKESEAGAAAEGDPQREELKATLQTIAAAASSAHESNAPGDEAPTGAEPTPVAAAAQKDPQTPAAEQKPRRRSRKASAPVTEPEGTDGPGGVGGEEPGTEEPGAKEATDA